MNIKIWVKSEGCLIEDGPVASECGKIRMMDVYYYEIEKRPNFNEKKVFQKKKSTVVELR